MRSGPPLKSLIRRSLMPATTLALLIPAAAGAALPPHGANGPLSPDLQQLARPVVAAKPPSQQAAALGLPGSGPGSLVREGARVLVEARFDAGAIARLDALRATGAEVIAASRRYQTITLSVLASALPAIAGVKGVEWVSAVRAPVVYSTECEGGSVISEGVAQINAKAAREAFPGLNGEGVTVGVLSDSYNTAPTAATHASEDETSSDLPGNPLNNCSLSQKVPVEIRSDLSSGEGGDEGRAMLQIVHDVAPAAKLAFATAFKGEIAFAQSIEELAAPPPGGSGAGVIVDDVGYWTEPFFQDGPVAAAINKVTAEGVTYLSAAGNDNLIGREGTSFARNIASWEAPSFRDGGHCPAVVESSLGAQTHCMDFDPGGGTDKTFGIRVEAKATLTVDLQWNEPWEGVKSDLDAYLLNAAGTQVLGASEEDNIAIDNKRWGSQRPIELLEWENTSGSDVEVQLAINHCFGPTCNPGDDGSRSPRLKFVLLENGQGVSSTEYPISEGGDVVGPAVYGHAGSPSAIAVGAIPFYESNEPERYSSRGPVTHYFEPVTGSGSAAPLGTAQIIPKPDIAATDCAATTFFDWHGSILEGEPAEWHFCGTSAAAPHAAGAVALMVQKAEAQGGGLAEPEPIRAALTESASPVGTFGACAVGAGLVETRGAVAALLAGPGSVPSLDCAPPDSPATQETEEPSSPTVSPTTVTTVPAPTPTPTPTPASVPATRIVKHPRRVVSTHGQRARVVFRFAADQAGVSFRCRVDRGRWHRCRAPLVLRLGLGRHVVRVKAVSSAGLADPTPAVFRFRVRRLGRVR